MPRPLAAPRTMVGTWEFSNADREKSCSITFRNDSNRVGKRVEFDPACATHFSFVKDVAVCLDPRDSPAREANPGEVTIRRHLDRDRIDGQERLGQAFDRLELLAAEEPEAFGGQDQWQGVDPRRSGRRGLDVQGCGSGGHRDR